MNDSIKTGLSFGLSSGVITTLGLMVGLNTSTGNRLVVLGGILTIAMADAFSDALGIHMSEESNKKKKHSEIWVSTISTFLTKLIVALTFAVPFLVLNLQQAVMTSLVWGFLLLIIFNYYIAKIRKEEPIIGILEHVGMALIVIFLSHFIGKIIANSLLGY